MAQPDQSFPITIELEGIEEVAAALRAEQYASKKRHDLRLAAEHISLLADFDTLLCLDHLHQVEKLWYQIETVRKTLRQFNGRVILADEVGLGKTIEACMLIKEYLLRGLVSDILILTPPSLVTQWQRELEEKEEKGSGMLCRKPMEKSILKKYMTTSKSPNKVAAVAYVTAQQSIPAYTHQFSPKKYTQHQLVAILVLKKFFTKDYRGITAILEDSSDLQRILELKTIPHFTTLQKSAARILKKKNIRKLITSTVTFAQKVKVLPKKSKLSAMDSTGFESGHTSQH